jgi:membrane associated rhomboid family serine protease
MGLAERDYAREGGGGALRRRPGAVPLIGFNTWLIIVNVAVFVLANNLLVHQVATLEQGIEWAPGVTSEQMARPLVDRTNIHPHPSRPGSFYREVYVPALTPSGAVATGPDGQPIYLRQPAGRMVVDRLPVLHALGHFSTGRLIGHWEVWRVLTFQFLHADVWHLVFNMIGLWFVGGMVESAIGSRRYAAFYLVCGVCGALLYMLLNLLGWALRVNLPGVLFVDPYTPLIGASAGVFGVLMAAAYIAPREIVAVMFIIPMELRTAVYLFVLFAAVNLFVGGRNAGGDAAHLGGALAGAYFVRRPHLLHDFFAVMPRGRGTTARAGRARASEAAAVDRILEKIRERGIGSLSSEERALLRRVSEQFDG